MISQGEFHALLKAVIHSASTDQCRDALNSVLIEFLGDETRWVSTDGHRVTVATLTTPEVGTGSFLAPLDDVKELLRIFKSKSDKSITPTVSGDALVVTNGKASLSIERHGAEYPDYRAALPADDTVLAGVARFNHSYLTQAVSACSGLMRKDGGVDIITRGPLTGATLRPVLDPSLKVVKSLEVYVMPMRRED